MENTVSTNYKISISEVIKIATTVLAIVGAVTFFIYKMQDLPPRVDKLEKDLPAIRHELTSEINALKSEMDKNGVKTDIILDDVKLIKSHIVNSNNK